jgi:hypothetical protein
MSASPLWTCNGLGMGSHRYPADSKHFEVGLDVLLKGPI